MSAALTIPKMLYFLLAGGMVIPLADRVAEVLSQSQLTPYLQLQVRGTKNVHTVQRWWS